MWGRANQVTSCPTICGGFGRTATTASGRPQLKSPALKPIIAGAADGREHRGTIVWRTVSPPALISSVQTKCRCSSAGARLDCALSAFPMGGCSRHLGVPPVRAASLARSARATDSQFAAHSNGVARTTMGDASDVAGETQAQHLPALVGVEEGSVCRAHLPLRRGAGAAAQDELIDHELPIIFADGTRRWAEAGIG